MIQGAMFGPTEIGPDDLKFKVSLVLIDLCPRDGLVGGPAATGLRAALEDGRA
jgi:hypothetical protein